MSEDYGVEMAIVFLDGEQRIVRELTFSRCKVAAQAMRLAEGASTHRELYVDFKKCYETKPRQKVVF